MRTPTNRPPELHPALQPDNPTLEVLKVRALRALADEANTIQAVMDLVRGLKGIKEPGRWEPHYRMDEWARLIRCGEYAAARLFILSNHA